MDGEQIKRAIETALRREHAATTINYAAGDNVGTQVEVYTSKPAVMAARIMAEIVAQTVGAALSVEPSEGDDETIRVPFTP